MRISVNPVLDIETLRWLPAESFEYDGPIEELRGAASAAQQQLGTTNAIGAQQQEEANQLEQGLIPGYTSLMNTGYLSPADKAAATTSEMGATAAPFKSAEFQAANRAGATGNASDLTANEDQLALEESQAAGTAAANLQQQQMQNQEAGMYGLGALSAQNTGEAESMYGMGPSTINAWSNAQMNNPMLQLGETIIGAGGKVGAAAAGKG
jgi:hypothetical protein